MTLRKSRPQTPQALRRSLTDRLRNAAKDRKADVAQIRKQYVFMLLFRRMFSEDEDTGQWMVLGGNALLLRTGGGRFTDDIDLSRADDWDDPNALLKELREIAMKDLGDGFRFEFTRAEPHDHTDRYGYGTRSVKIFANALLGGQEFESFSIDVTQRRHITGPVLRHRPTPVIDHESLNDLPEIPVVPIENQLADKVCGMYERHHGGKPSTRYRDLADIVRIVNDLEISATRLTEMLDHEQRRRRPLTLPRTMDMPDRSWVTRYPEAAKRFAEFPVEFHSLDASLARAKGCLDVVLAGERTCGTWDPTEQIWSDAA